MQDCTRETHFICYRNKCIHLGHDNLQRKNTPKQTRQIIVNNIKSNIYDRKAEIIPETRFEILVIELSIRDDS